MRCNKFLSTLIASVMSIVLISSMINLTGSAEIIENRTIKVMPLGDSITDGYWLTGGYRTTLCDLLMQNGYSNQIDFVGPNCGGNCYDPQHAGYSGYSIDNIDQLNSISGARTGLSSFIDWLMESYPADVIMLQIGTNDILSYYDLDNISVRLENLLNTILQHIDDSGMLYVATIPCMDANNTLYISPYYFTTETMDEIINNYNKQIKEMVSKMQSQGKNVELADINSVLDKNDLYDGVHPNIEGYQKMGAYWYSKLVPYLNGETVPDNELLYGDVDNDGAITVNDILMMKDFLLKNSKLLEPQNADINKDNKINIFDFLIFKKNISIKIN